jgi:hypothetical protein
MGFLFSKNSQDKQAVRQEDVARLVEPPHKGLYFPPQIAGWKDGRSEETTAEPEIKGMLDRDRSTVSRPLCKGASSNALSVLAGQMNLRGWQRHRRQMTCPHLRIYAMIELLKQVKVRHSQGTVDALLANPQKYGF